MAHQNPLTTNPFRTLPANQNSRPLRISRNRPSVTMVMGSVSSTRTGLTKVLSRPSTSAAISALPNDDTAIPGKVYATISNATALRIQTRIRPMIVTFSKFDDALVAVMLLLVMTFNRYVDIGGLIWTQRGQRRPKLGQMQACHFFIKVLG